MNNVINLESNAKMLDTGNSRLYVKFSDGNIGVVIDQGESFASWGLPRFELFTTAKIGDEPCHKIESQWTISGIDGWTNS